ncbi:phosphatase PAP2 family protein [Paenibacillus sp. MMS18-CY102]|uniref:phosphatase PAP2 family protein n=1 Tax=Paenibacillus sp. MMS18-CY102 TaxID=2682849 RepID=UPI001365463E|nr:phosphatase PAP2 family protein [Paenibacillus sp. MMS18-CY102]MWC27842.1 phosphatase PAP2 family protein [Paenibacillus sp. MMS18-CY102]
MPIRTKWLSRERLAFFAPLLLMLVFPVLGYLYKVFNQPDHEVYSLVTSFDKATPFLRAFVLPYSVWIVYIYICLVYFFFKDRTSYYRGVLMYTLCALTCYMIYSVFQTTVPRPEVIGDDVFSQLMRYVYERDRPFNCFPSIHCFSSYLMIRLLAVSPARNKLNRTLIYGMSSTIILSTLFVKQHVLWDVIGAVALVEVMYLLVIVLLPRLIGTRQRQRGLDA